jgi:hypothetical protein
MRRNFILGLFAAGALQAQTAIKFVTQAIGRISTKGQLLFVKSNGEITQIEIGTGLDIVTVNNVTSLISNAVGQKISYIPLTNIDGNYTLPSNTSLVVAYLNGLAQRETLDFTKTGQVIRFVLPVTENDIVAAIVNIP